MVFSALFKGGSFIWWHCYGIEVARCQAYIMFSRCRRKNLHKCALQTERCLVCKWWQTCRIYCTDLHFLVHLVTVKVCISEWANCFSLLGEQQRYHAEEQLQQKCRAKPSPAQDCFLLSWSKKREGIPTSALSPLFSEGKVALPFLAFTNTSIQLMQALNSSLSFSYPILETALGISKRSQVFICYMTRWFLF